MLPHLCVFADQCHAASVSRVEGEHHRKMEVGLGVPDDVVL